MTINKNELQSLISSLTAEKSLNFKVGNNLINPHLFIKQAESHYIKMKREHRPLSFMHSQRDVITMDVSKNSLRRTLIFMDTLIKLFIARGHNVLVLQGQRYTSYNGIKFCIYDEYFDFSIREKKNRRMVKNEKFNWLEASYIPSGNLVLKIDDYPIKEWCDSKSIKLEDRLIEILAYLELKAKLRKNEREIRKIELEKAKRLKILRDEKNKLIEEELKFFKSMIQDSCRWNSVVNLRNYLDALSSKAQKNFIDNEVKWERIDKLRKMIDWYDPLIESEYDLFKDVDRETLNNKHIY